MSRRGVLALVAAGAMAVVLFGLQTPSFAAMRTVELRTPGCV
jgi:hypothetical protein